jgi:hypothetical protein
MVLKDRQWRHAYVNGHRKNLPNFLGIHYRHPSMPILQSKGKKAKKVKENKGFNVLTRLPKKGHC